MASTGADLDAVVSFHGSFGLVEEADPGTLRAKILICHGADDAFIPAEQVAEVKDKLERARADYTFITYEGAQHSFTNPEADRFAQEHGMAVAYHAEADAASWNDMQAFLQQAFAE
jgi:dienelactone hydrolase